ncbi:alpha/beta hydrolase [Conexibacter sp. SYSU D00693]|uniref:alpha/beta hydrolase n=1 Tax=Conexibacter sp. SYSU D00693 TaxID=2812560 RepID=UPI00196A3EC9|nr:alpha/beta hydrolase [Conexibacter sp. SYSU D00693]
MAAQLHPQVQALVDTDPVLGDGSEPGPAELEALRAGYLQVALERGGAVEPVARVEDLVVPRPDGAASVPARAYWPAVPAPGEPGAIVWLHGGGWCIGDLEGVDRVCRTIANAAGHVVLSVDYRLAPEAPFPAAIEDADAALRWARTPGGARQLGVEPERVVVGGDSAGGNLAAVAALHARSDGLPAVRAQLLVYPAVDPEMGSDAYREFAEGPLLTAAEMRTCWRTYLGGRPADDPDVAPLRADVAGAAPAFVAVAGVDPLRDDGLRYAEHLRAAGVAVQLNVFDDMAHGFLRWAGVVDRARELMGWLGEHARASLA